MNNETDDEENTPLPLANVINIKPFVNSTNDRLTYTENRLYNIEDSLNTILNIKFPVVDRKLDRILDCLRDMNKPVKKVGVFRRFWSWLF